MCSSSKILCDTMYFDDSCYFVDHIDECISDFVHESWFKADLNDLLAEEPLDDHYKKITVYPQTILWEKL